MGSTAFGPDADWYAFGMLAARCMLAIEHLAAQSIAPMERYRLVLDHLAKAKTKLSPLEYDLISHLIEEDPSLRYRHPGTGSSRWTHSRATRLRSSP